MNSQRIVVCVGWRPGNPYRERNWVNTRLYYQSVGLPVVTGDSDPALPFNQPQAINRAVGSLDDSWEVVIVPDADTMLAEVAINDAVELALATGALVSPVSRYWRQQEGGGLRGVPESVERTGVQVWHRNAWDALGGEDERFTGWSFHDTAAVWAAQTFGLYAECDGDAIHLWHPRRTPDESFWWAGSEDWLTPPDDVDVMFNGFRLTRMPPLALRYYAALGKPDEMRALLDERFEGQE